MIKLNVMPVCHTCIHFEAETVPIETPVPDDPSIFKSTIDYISTYRLEKDATITCKHFAFCEYIKQLMEAEFKQKRTI